MSRHTTTRMLVYPSPTDSINLPYAGLWADNPWTEIFASTTELIFIAGLSWIISPVGGAAAQVEFALGAEGEEELLHVYRVEVKYASNTNHQWTWFDVPLGAIPIGSRLSMRIRGFAPLTNNKVNIMYFENLVSGHKSNGKGLCWPIDTNSINLAWSAIAWENTDFVELTPGEDVEITITSVQFQPSAFYSCAAEIDLAAGAVGTEHANILTTKRFFHAATAGFNQKIVFPGGFPIPAGTRVSFRVRRGAAGTAPSKWSFNYVRQTSFLS